MYSKLLLPVPVVKSTMTGGNIGEFLRGSSKSKVVPNIDEIMKARAEGGAKVVVPPAMPRVPGLQPKVEASPTKLSL